MKRSLLITIVCLSGLLSQGQIQVTSSDLPVIGNLVVQAVDTITSVSPGSPGTNKVWDLSNLVAHRYDSAQYVLPQGLPNFNNYSQSNIVANILNPTAEELIPAYMYMFNRHSSDGIYQVGAELFFTSSIPDLTMNMHWKYEDNCLFMPLPMNYSDHHELVINYEVHAATVYLGTLYDSTKIVIHDEIVYDVDASGTMITPYHTFEVLRVKSVRTHNQLRYIWNGSGWDFDEEENSGPETSYMWYTNDYFQVGYCDDQRANGFTFFKSETVVGTKNPVFATNYEVYPNPVSDIFRVDGIKVPSRIEIYNCSGQLLRSETDVMAMNISTMPEGLYLIKIYSNDKVELKKLIKI